MCSACGELYSPSEWRSERIELCDDHWAELRGLWVHTICRACVGVGAVQHGIMVIRDGSAVPFGSADDTEQPVTCGGDCEWSGGDEEEPVHVRW